MEVAHLNILIQNCSCLKEMQDKNGAEAEPNLVIIADTKKWRQEPSMAVFWEALPAPD